MQCYRYIVLVAVRNIYGQHLSPNGALTCLAAWEEKTKSSRAKTKTRSRGPRLLLPREALLFFGLVRSNCKEAGGKLLCSSNVHFIILRSHFPHLCFSRDRVFFRAEKRRLLSLSLDAAQKEIEKNHQAFGCFFRFLPFFASREGKVHLNRRSTFTTV